MTVQADYINVSDLVGNTEDGILVSQINLSNFLTKSFRALGLIVMIALELGDTIY